MSEQTQLFPTGKPESRASKEAAIFANLIPGAEKVMPTALKVYHNNKNDAVLVVRIQHGDNPVPRGVAKTLNTLLKHGKSPDAPGSVTVIVLWWDIGELCTVALLTDPGEVHKQLDRKSVVSIKDFRKMVVEWWQDGCL